MTGSFKSETQPPRSLRPACLDRVSGHQAGPPPCPLPSSRERRPQEGQVWRDARCDFPAAGRCRALAPVELRWAGRARGRASLAGPPARGAQRGAWANPVEHRQVARGSWTAEEPDLGTGAAEWREKSQMSKVRKSRRLGVTQSPQRPQRKAFRHRIHPRGRGYAGGSQACDAGAAVG